MTLKTKHRGARLRSSSYNDADQTIEVVWSRGAPVLRNDGFEQYVELLSLAPGAVRLDRLNAGAPFLDTHCSDGLANVIGAVLPGSAEIRDGLGVATIRLSQAPGVADSVQKIREGVIRNVSVGYVVHESVRSQEGKGPIFETAVDWEPVEISAVAVPADPGAQIRSRGRSGLGAANNILSETERGARMARQWCKPVDHASARKIVVNPSGRALTLLEVAQRTATAAEAQRQEQARNAEARRTRIGNRW